MLGFLGGGSSGHIVDSSDQSDDDDLSDAVDGVRTLQLWHYLAHLNPELYKEHQHQLLHKIFLNVTSEHIFTISEL